MIPYLIAALLLAAGPAGLDATVGDDIHPNHPLYVVEKMGERERQLIGQGKPAIGRMDERYGEYEFALTQGVERRDVLDEANTESIMAEQELSIRQTQAQQTPSHIDDMEVIAAQSAFRERFQAHIRNMKQIRGRVPQQARQGLDTAIQNQEVKLNQTSQKIDEVKDALESRLNKTVQVQTQDGGVTVSVPELPEIQPVEFGGAKRRAALTARGNSRR